MRVSVLPLVLLCLCSAAAVAEADEIDLNEATHVELVELGLSESRAAQIVSHRKKTGPFLQIEELAVVAQIRKEDVQRLRGRVRVGESLATKPAKPVEVVATGQEVALENVKTEWQNLYGLIVFAASAQVKNTGDEPLPYARAKLELFDDDDEVVAETVGYNLTAEVLAADQIPGTREEKLAAILPIAPGAADFLRLSLEKTDIGKPFSRARVSVVPPETNPDRPR